MNIQHPIRSLNPQPQRLEHRLGYPIKFIFVLLLFCRNGTTQTLESKMSQWEYKEWAYEYSSVKGKQLYATSYLVLALFPRGKVIQRRYKEHSAQEDTFVFDSIPQWAQLDTLRIPITDTFFVQKQWGRFQYSHKKRHSDYFPALNDTVRFVFDTASKRNRLSPNRTNLFFIPSGSEYIYKGISVIRDYKGVPRQCKQFQFHTLYSAYMDVFIDEKLLLPIQVTTYRIVNWGKTVQVLSEIKLVRLKE